MKGNKKFTSFGNSSSTNAKSDSIFVASVIGFVDEESDSLETLSSKSDINTINYCIVRTINKAGFPTTLHIPFANISHGADIPAEGELVLCVVTQLGTFIVDRLSPFAYGINYDPSFVGSMVRSATTGAQEVVRLNIDSPFFKKETLEENKPFKIKPYSKSILGRNHQYLIFDHGYNLNSDDTKKELLKDGSTIKIGFRETDKSSESHDDNLMIITNGFNASSYFNEKILNKEFQNITDLSNKSVGIQSDDIILIGKQYLVLYSVTNLIIASQNVSIEAVDNLNLNAQTVSIASDEVNLGKGDLQPAVLGDEVVDMMKDILDVLTKLTTGIISTPPSTPALISPEIVTKIAELNIKYTNSNSPYLSKKVKVSK